MLSDPMPERVKEKISYREFQAVAIAKILVDERSKAIGAYDVEHVQACFDSCPVTSYLVLELGWQES